MLLTRCSGLFVRIPEGLSDRSREPDKPGSNEKSKFHADVLRALNLVLLRLALDGEISQPVSPVDVALSGLLRGHAAVAQGTESRTPRTVEPTLALRFGARWIFYGAQEEALAVLDDMTDALRLEEVSPTLPQLLLGALWNYRSQAMAEALIDSWMVIEQIINRYWSEHRAGLADELRAARLDDGRTYTAAIRIEILQTVGRLPPNVAEATHIARKRRNDLVHGASISDSAGKEAILAMSSLLEHYLGRTIVVPEPPRELSW